MSEFDTKPLQPDPALTPDWWMDGDAAPPADDTPARATVTPSNDRERFNACDLQLVHAMLLHLNRNEDAARQARIDCAVHAIRQAPSEAADKSTETATELVTPLRKSHRLGGAIVRWAVAACLLIAAVSWFSLSSSSSANAALDVVVQAMDEAVDRTYEILVELADRPPRRDPPRKPPRETDHWPPEDHRPGLDGALLCVRGRDQFVLFRAAPGGSLVVNGSNGRENWLVRPDRPVLISSDATAFRIPMPENMATLPFIDIRESVQSLRHGYRIEERPAEPIFDGDEMLWRHLQARKIDPETRGARVISLWFHPTTKLIGRLRFEQVNLQGRPEPRNMTISLLSSEPLPANWFDHDAHHPPDAPVERTAP